MILWNSGVRSWKNGACEATRLSLCTQCACGSAQANRMNRLGERFKTLSDKGNVKRLNSRMLSCLRRRTLNEENRYVLE